MCKSCFPEAKEIGIIAPGYSLILNNDKYHILGGQGHADHEIFTFDNKPWPDPDPDCKDENGELVDKWLEETGKIEQKFKLPVETAFRFLTSCEEKGWKKGSFSNWLFDKCGNMILDHELDIIYLTIDEMLKNQSFEKLDEYILTFNENSDINILLGVLTITNWKKSKLKNRQRLIEIAKSKSNKIPNLLKGLE